MLQARTAYVISTLIALCAVSGCAYNSVRGSFPPSTALTPATSGMLAETAGRIEEGLGRGESAFWLLDRADLSFDARLALVDRATRSLDIQYFIWEKDPSSRLFASRILEAADRGVKVRILLDDLTLNDQDSEYFGLDQHPNIELRTYNPWKLRKNSGRYVEFLFRFRRLNNRMHNKVIVADGQFAIVGGRNIGDRYFGIWDAFVQNDLDIMLAGPLTQEVMDSFDLYWNSTESFPVAVVLTRKAERPGAEETRDFVTGFYLEHSDRLVEFPLERLHWNDFFEEIEKSYVPARATYVYDDPEITEEAPAELVEPLTAFIAQAQESVLISSPYLVPDREMVRLFERLEQRGVEVEILTNSLASNNHMIAHAAYEGVRRRLLRMGVDLYEARSDSAAMPFYTTPPGMPAYMGLHTRAAVVDGRYSYVGSANIDPRSLELNTELGLFIDSRELADQLAALIRRDMQPEMAWRVTLDGRQLQWTSAAGTLDRQPALSRKQRFQKFLIKLLPIKKQS